MKNTNTYLERGFELLKVEENYATATDFFNAIIDNHDDIRAYKGLLMAKICCKEDNEIFDDFHINYGTYLYAPDSFAKTVNQEIFYNEFLTNFRYEELNRIDNKEAASIKELIIKYSEDVLIDYLKQKEKCINDLLENQRYFEAYYLAYDLYQNSNYPSAKYFEIKNQYFNQLDKEIFVDKTRTMCIVFSFIFFLFYLISFYNFNYIQMAIFLFLSFIFSRKTCLSMYIFVPLIFCSVYDYSLLTLLKDSAWLNTFLLLLGVCYRDIVIDYLHKLYLFLKENK